MFNLVSLVKAAGYLGIFGILFAESGLLVGFFLPGDSLLFTAGFLASQGYLNIWWLIVISFMAAITGDSVGYWTGKKFGPKIFKKDESIFFHKKHVETARRFYHRHGGKTIIIARFLPVIRTFAPILAGVGNMHYPLFVFYNVVGGLLWTAGLSLLGWYLGSTIPNIDRYLLPIILLIILVSASPTLIGILRNKEHRRALKHTIQTSLRRRRP